MPESGARPVPAVGWAEALRRDFDFAAGTSPGPVAIGHLNGDSFPDFAVAKYGTNNVSVLLSRIHG
ncbi:MAG: hypothetical protein JJE10_11025 [Thermoleophilia bacterium]|nr:hypothetical protein [Thermoleophilia bacterium]